jgi:tetratricopeptide (TPR) repeat protein
LANQKFCSECGYRLESEQKYCPQCGTKVVGKNSDKSNKSAVNKKQQIIPENAKHLNPKIIYGILGGGIIIILAIILASGVLDSPNISNSTNQVKNQSDVNSGVNLNNLQTINQLEEKVKQNPNDYNSLLELAHLKNDSGLYDAAIVNYKAYLEKYPKDADARVDMGVCYYNLRDYQKAIDEMETALKYVPNHQIAFLNLGVVNLTAGNIEKSKEWLKKAYEVNPTNEVGLKAQQLLNNH